MARVVSQLLVVTALGVVTAACIGKDPFAPGTSLGTFGVAARLTSSSCGQAPDPWKFDVHLRHEDATLDWVQGGVPVSGAVDASMKARLTSSVTQTVRDADPKTGIAACVLTRADALELTLAGDGGAAIHDAAETTSFSGTLTYTFAPAADAACWPEVESGAYATLPCTVTYAISAVRTAPPR